MEPSEKFWTMKVWSSRFTALGENSTVVSLVDVAALACPISMLPPVTAAAGSLDEAMAAAVAPTAAAPARRRKPRRLPPGSSPATSESPSSMTTLAEGCRPGSGTRSASSFNS